MVSEAVPRSSRPYRDERAAGATQLHRRPSQHRPHLGETVAEFTITPQSLPATRALFEGRTCNLGPVTLRSNRAARPVRINGVSPPGDLGLILPAALGPLLSERADQPCETQDQQKAGETQR